MSVAAGGSSDTLPRLPDTVARSLTMFVDAARTALDEDLQSVVLFGSAAEGQLRPTSDVNVILVLRRFEAARIDAVRDPLRTAHAAIRLEAMFLLASEIDAAVEAFAVKFADVLRRRHILYGADPFAAITLSPAAELARLRQVLLNLILRLRQRYVLHSLRPEQAARDLADAAGPLRACAAALLEVVGRPAPSPKQALVTLAAELPGGPWGEVLERLSESREQPLLAAEHGAPGALLRLIALATALYQRVESVT